MMIMLVTAMFLVPRPGAKMSPVMLRHESLHHAIVGATDIANRTPVATPETARLLRAGRRTVPRQAQA